MENNSALEQGALAKSTLPDAALEIDHALAEIERELEVLLNLTPVNAAEAWADFERSGFSTVPALQSRPLGFDPDLVRRRLYDLEIEHVEDAALAKLFRDKRAEIGRYITLLEDRDTSRFLHGSQQVYGDVAQPLVEDALRLLESIPLRTADDERVTASAFAEAAQRELDHYRETFPGFDGKLEIRSDVSDLMVSHGRFLIPAGAHFRRSRVAPLIQHEVGTHVLTYFNGAAQPLTLLAVGLPDYDETQEGLAVLAEFVTGGLDPQRMRLLAARVVGVKRVLAGAGFLEIFEELHERHSFAPRVAWGIAIRVARSGGFSKDVIYLRGISRVLEFLAERRSVEPLLVGKLALDHVPLVEELLERDVLKPPWLRPRWMGLPEAEDRLQRVYDGMDVHDLVKEVVAA